MVLGDDEGEDAGDRSRELRERPNGQSSTEDHRRYLHVRRRGVNDEGVEKA